jgi:hypothetical protein
MSVTTSLRSRSFPSLSTSAGFSLPALPYRASFISPPSKPHKPGIAIAPGCLAANAILPNAGGAASSILDARRHGGWRGCRLNRGDDKLRAIPWISSWTSYVGCLFWLVTSLRFVIYDGGKLSDGARQSQRKIVVKTRVLSHFRLDRGFMKMSCALAARHRINSQSMLNVRTRKEPHYVIIGTDRPVY